MEHTGKIWMSGSDGEGSAGSITVTDEEVRVAVNGLAVGAWPTIAATPLDGDSFEVRAGGRTLRFRPDDYVAFGAEVEALAFRAHLAPQPPARSAPSPVAGGSSVKSAGLAAVLSAVWPGLGQIYNGQIGKGVVVMGVQFVNALLTFVLIGFVTGFIVWVWAVYDAYTVAERNAAV